jgi:hypothetical protein
VFSCLPGPSTLEEVNKWKFGAAYFQATGMALSLEDSFGEGTKTLLKGGRLRLEWWHNGKDIGLEVER